jgi:hypothetical protein
MLHARLPISCWLHTMSSRSSTQVASSKDIPGLTSDGATTTPSSDRADEEAATPIRPTRQSQEPNPRIFTTSQDDGSRHQRSDAWTDQSPWQRDTLPRESSGSVLPSSPPELLQTARSSSVQTTPSSSQFWDQNQGSSPTEQAAARAQERRDGAIASSRNGR